MNGISVIVCCYNSAERLPVTIQHLAQQSIPGDMPWEVLIVNNNSSDDTVAVAFHEWSKYTATSILRVIDESKPGLSHARLSGVKDAKYECIIFCDDDNWLEKDYLVKASSIISRDITIGALGGQSKVYFENDTIPEWFENNKGDFAVGKQAAHSGDITSRGYVWGAGQVTRRSLYLKAFERTPSLLTDRKGNNLNSGGDTEYCCRLILMNYGLHYDESLKFIHYVPANRLTEGYRNALHKAFDESHRITIMYHLMILSKRASYIKKFVLINKSVIKYCISSIKLFSKTTPAYERLMLYFLTGLNFIKVTPEAKEIYHFAQAVTHE